MAKKLKGVKTRKDGTTKEIYVVVDDVTAKMLEQVSEEIRNQYIIDEFNVKMQELKDKRYTSSLEQKMENGFDCIDEEQDVEAISMFDFEMEEIKNAIKQLDYQQQWLIKEVYVKGRTKIELAKELGISNSSIRDRFRVIYKKIKNFLDK